jgi:hypothetical protein
MARLIAFYLPQYHPIPENDAWWGKGFTEWTNVSKGRPMFRGHEQPRLPADLGFYDLRVDDVREDQAALASRYGIGGFCYYYYWFNGRRLLERPLDSLLQTGRPDFPFCICWANETWSRRWDGSEHEILIEQVHTADSDQRFIADVIPILKDPRYIKVAGAPLLIVYRFSLLPEPVATTETWRAACRKAGIERVHIAAVQSFGIGDPRLFGCDSAVEFPPHGISAREITDELDDKLPEFEGKVYDYRDLITAGELETAKAPFPVFHAVMPSWDNTARRGARGHVFHHSSPEAYEVWLRNALNRAAREPVEGEEIVFINAWNEWAEGAHLEPDRRWGHAYLEATRRALSERMTWEAAARSLRARVKAAGINAESLVGDLEFRIRALEASNNFLRKQIDIDKFRHSMEALQLQEGAPDGLFRDDIRPGLMNLDQVNSHPPAAIVRLPVGGKALFRGWQFTPGLAPLNGARHTHFVLFDPIAGRRYQTPFGEWEFRSDVAKSFPDQLETITGNSGFSVVLDLANVAPGRYRFAVVEQGDGGVGATIAHPILQVGQ